MKVIYTRAAVVLLTILGLLAAIHADLCGVESQEIAGNWFCKSVKAIQYSNVGIPGSYRKITHMGSDGTCSSTVQTFSGPLSPLNEEVSIHFRGPMHLKQVAVYAPSMTKTSRKERDTVMNRYIQHQHPHSHLHSGSQHHGEFSDNDKRDEVVATINGNIVSWENNYHGPTSQAPRVPSSCMHPATVTAPIDGIMETWINNWNGGNPLPTCQTDAAGLFASLAPVATSVPLPGPEAASSNAFTAHSQPAPTLTPANSPADTPGSAGHAAHSPPSGPGIVDGQMYERIAFYDSVSQTNENLVFLGNYGGQGSGVFDYNFGASLAFANSAGTGGSASPQILADQLIPSGHEITIMRAQECGEDDCGYVRPGSVAYHGFEGADKAFLLEFAMPMDGNTDFQGDLPAIWILNAQIPLTVQYGTCNCWPGCGEFDIVEAMSGANKFLKSTLHGEAQGGDSDYLDRPTSSTMKIAVIFSSATSTIQVQVLPQDVNFSSTLAASDINNMLSEQSPDNLVSHFHVS